MGVDGGYSDVKLFLRVWRCIKGEVAPCRESGLFIYCKEAVSLQGFSVEPVPITTLVPAPTLQLNAPVKLHPAREDSREGEKARQRVPLHP